MIYNMRKLSRKLIPNSVIQTKLLVINRFGSVWDIPEDVILLIKEYLFFDIDFFQLHWSYQMSMQICSINRNINTDTIHIFHMAEDGFPIEMHEWRYCIFTKNTHVEINTIMCSICGNYYHHTDSKLNQNQVEFTDKIMCYCDFDYGGHGWNDDNISDNTSFNDPWDDNPSVDGHDYDAWDEAHDELDDIQDAWDD